MDDNVRLALDGLAIVVIVGVGALVKSTLALLQARLDTLTRIVNDAHTVTQDNSAKLDKVLDGGMQHSVTDALLKLGVGRRKDDLQQGDTRRAQDTPTGDNPVGK